MSKGKPIRNAAPERMEISALDADGFGVARVEGKVIFVDGALAGERVWSRRFQGSSRFDRAEVVSVERAAAQRVTPPCPHFGLCGGCTLQHLEPGAQVAVKQRQLEENLWRIGKVRPERILPPIFGPSLGYRSKARLSVRVPQSRGALVGFRERQSSYVADMNYCFTLDPRVAHLLLPLRALVAKLGEPQGIPQIEVATTPEVVALVFRHLLPLSSQDVALMRDFAQQHGVQLWLQSGGPATIHCVWPAEPAPLCYRLPEFNVSLRFDPLVFTQVNQAMNQSLVRRAMALLQPRPGERILDLFCGLGNFTLPIARMGAEVLGVEGDARLVALAGENAQSNGLQALARFAVADLTRIGPEDLSAWGRVDKMLIDPPRSGAMEVLKALGKVHPERIVYVSCGPATLARDAEYLVYVRGYRLVAAGVVNMFPHTAHVESIALFQR